MYEIRKPLVVDALSLVMTTGVKDQVLRPFNINVDYNSLNTIEETVRRREGRNVLGITSHEIAKQVPDLLTLSNNPIASANISNGWGESRGIFKLRLVEESATGYGYNVTIIQGYTSYWGISQSLYIDDNMEFFINSITQMHVTTDINNILKTRIVAYYNVLIDQTGDVDYQDMRHTVPEELVISRPEDITLVLSQNSFIDELETPDANIVTMYDNIYRGKSMFSNPEPLLVNRDATIPTRAVGDILTRVAEADTNTRISFNNKATEVYEQATSYLQTSSIRSIEFMNRLINHNNNIPTAKFTTAVLKAIVDPVDPEKVKIIPFHGDIIDARGFSVEDSEDLYQPTYEATVAQTVLLSLGALLTESFLTTVTFTLTNVSGKYEVSITDPIMLVEGLDPIILVETLKAKILNEIMPVITKNNQIVVFAFGSVSTDHEGSIRITINNGPEVPFILPLFADSLLTDLVNTKDGFNTNINGFKTLTDVILSPR